MIICFHCKKDIKKILDELISSGNYTDYGELISSAIENLAVLHKQLATKGALIIDDDDQKKTIFDKKHAVTPKLDNKRFNKGNIHSLKMIPQVYEDNIDNIPEIFKKPDLAYKPSKLAKIPSDVFNIDSQVPLDRWIFGQYNRLLPVKVSCRALANLIIKKKSSSINLDEATSIISKEAAELGEYLKFIDTKLGLLQDEALSTAFPKNDEISNKSIMRYANHFVASMNNQGQLSGLLIEFKFINRLISNKLSISLTEPGYKFSELTNPVLDGDLKESKLKFSDEEVTFLLNHISQKVPAENYAYKTLLKIIADGSNTPNEIDSELEKYIAGDRKKELSKSFLSSQRSSTISRMTDIGLVIRIRNGVSITYEVTKSGMNYLNENF